MNALKCLLPLSLLALAGCSILGSGQRDPVTIYSPEIRVEADPAWPSVDWSLVIAKPSAARLVDSPRINVRPVPGEMQVYRGVSWAQPATDIVQDAVLRTLEDSGRIRAVADADAGIRADYKLVMDIRRFESDYSGQSMPSAVVEISAKLVHNRDQRVVVARTFLQRQTASGTGTAQVVNAFEDALSNLSREIAGWVLSNGQSQAVPAAVPPRH